MLPLLAENGPQPKEFCGGFLRGCCPIDDASGAFRLIPDNCNALESHKRFPSDEIRCLLETDVDVECAEVKVYGDLKRSIARYG